jgi:hypothetical protein
VWLHDIRYASGLAVTGLYALDGVRYLRDAQHADTLPCRLVRHHRSRDRGLAGLLSSEFKPAPRGRSSALTYCDMTTSADGEPVPVEQRLAEIHHRYGRGHLVNRSIQRGTPMILRAVELVQDGAARTALLRRPEAGKCLNDLDLG